MKQALVLGATALVCYTLNKPSALGPWIAALLGRCPTRLVTVATANKLARIA